MVVTQSNELELAIQMSMAEAAAGEAAAAANPAPEASAGINQVSCTHALAVVPMHAFLARVADGACDLYPSGVRSLITPVPTFCSPRLVRVA